MSTEETKPRECVVGFLKFRPSRTISVDADMLKFRAEDPNFDSNYEYVPMIEKSAYDKLLKERDELKSELDYTFKNKCGWQDKASEHYQRILDLELELRKEQAVSAKAVEQRDSWIKDCLRAIESFNIEGKFEHLKTRADADLAKVREETT